MTRRSFIAALSAVFLVPQNRSPFTSGSLGRHGKWFRNFGTGMGVTLHGMEAVVTPEQALLFLVAPQ